MSDDLQGDESSRAPPPSGRNGCLTAFMVLVGVIMLLPGVCALIFAVGDLSSSHPDPVVMLLVLIGLAIAIGGIVLIRAAVRGIRRG